MKFWKVALIRANWELALTLTPPGFSEVATEAYSKPPFCNRYLARNSAFNSVSLLSWATPLLSR